MANGDTGAPERGIVVDPLPLIIGGAVALIGVIVLGLFLWMVPHSATRANHAACEALRPAGPEELKKEHPELCAGTACVYPIQAPDFTATDRNGKPVKLSSFRGKVVLLNFWASWCHVCSWEKPHLQGMAGDLASSDFAVVALASDHNWSETLLSLVEALAPGTPLPKGEFRNAPLPAALEAYGRGLPDGLPFQVLQDRPASDDNVPGQIAASWGIRAVPESVLIDREGRIRAYFVNKRDWQSPVAETCLRSFIDEE